VVLDVQARVLEVARAIDIEVALVDVGHHIEVVRYGIILLARRDDSW
jgi:hypothetical protein